MARYAFASGESSATGTSGAHDWMSGAPANAGFCGGKCCPTWLATPA